jgi:hypothetical protein
MATDPWLQIYTPAQPAQQYGRNEYIGSMMDWSKMVYNPGLALTNQLAPQLQQMMNYYKPGGGYGQGQRMEAEQAVKGGVAQDLGNMVASGMSSQFGARGTQTRAGSELSKLYKNIEDTRSQLWQQSTQPYNQLMASIANMYSSRPTYNQYMQLGKATPSSIQSIY